MFYTVDSVPVNNLKQAETNAVIPVGPTVVARRSSLITDPVVTTESPRHESHSKRERERACPCYLIFIFHSATALRLL